MCVYVFESSVGRPVVVLAPVEQLQAIATAAAIITKSVRKSNFEILWQRAKLWKWRQKTNKNGLNWSEPKTNMYKDETIALYFGKFIRHCLPHRQFRWQLQIQFKFQQKKNRIEEKISSQLLVLAYDCSQDIGQQAAFSQQLPKFYRMQGSRHRELVSQTNYWKKHTHFI